MKYPWIDEYLLRKPGVTKDLKVEWNWIRYMIGGKLFAAICLDNENKPYYITLKLDPAEGEFLRQQYEDILPGYYCNKVHWNSVKPDGNLPDDLLREMLDSSYKLVLAGLSGVKRQKALITSYCGLDCGNCKWKEPCHCGGCTATMGMPFHADKTPCPIAACAMEKGIPFCGACKEFPCPLLDSFSRDPDHGDDPPGARIEACRLIHSLLNTKQGKT